MTNQDESEIPDPAKGDWLPVERLFFFFAFGFLALAIIFAYTYDLDLLRAIYLSPNARVVSFWKAASFLGSRNFLGPVVAITSLLLIWRRQGANALELALGWAICALTVEWLKWLIGRDRPPVPQFDSAAGTAFPSGHAAQSLYVYGYLWILLTTSGNPGDSISSRRIYGWMIPLAFGALPILVGLSRLYLGLHWPSDVLAGWGIGLFFSGIALLIRP